MSDEGAAGARRRRGLLRVAEWGAAIALVGWIAFCLVAANRASIVGSPDHPRCAMPGLAAGFWLTPTVVLLAPLLLRWWKAERGGADRSLAARARLAVGGVAWLAATLVAGAVWALLVLEVLVA